MRTFFIFCILVVLADMAGDVEKIRVALQTIAAAQSGLNITPK